MRCRRAATCAKRGAGRESVPDVVGRPDRAIAGLLAVAGTVPAPYAYYGVAVPPLGMVTTVPDVPPPDLASEKVAAGGDLYQRFCAGCHGTDLAGDLMGRSPTRTEVTHPPRTRRVTQAITATTCCSKSSS